MNMTGVLIDKYHILLKKYGFEENSNSSRINNIIRKKLTEFVSSCKKPAIWCYGEHTKMLMSDFIFEMKNVKYIIDEKLKNKDDSGFIIIGSDEIEENNIDGIIISSYKFRNEILSEISNKYPEVKVLDIYEALDKEGVRLEAEYYNGNHPYNFLRCLNKEIREYKKKANETNARGIQQILLNIKDFRLALEWVLQFKKDLGNDWEQYESDVRELYQLELACVERISAKNVLMFCVDGLRNKDLKKMQRFNEYIHKNTVYFSNAYSVSTSTFESLIPAYGGYKDLSNKYYERNLVSSGDCAFINEAKIQKRKIYFYTDSFKFIEDDEIRITDESQMATQKIWDFIQDALQTDNGLFYIHILYESHYSYPNPYTEDDIIADGKSIMFDYLDKNGGKLRTDYDKQHDDALKYLDDTLVPFLDRLKCGMVFFADHGNVILPITKKLIDTKYTEHTFSQDLIRIPLAIKSGKNKVKVDDRLCSLYSINDMVISLLCQKEYKLADVHYVKIMRSRLYNPDFNYIFKALGYERGLQSFEVFVFAEGYKLAVYEDGQIELYNLQDEVLVDEKQKMQIFDIVKEDITVKKQ